MTFIDESIFRIEPIVKHGWFLKGSKPSCPVNWSRGKECVFGALNFENGGKLMSKQAKRINSKTFIEFAQLLMRDIGSFAMPPVRILIPERFQVLKGRGRFDNLISVLETLEGPQISAHQTPSKLVW
ncbi:hypothetical protein AKJ47_01770 [candidate division MSBL1 archaeon SCGC-AAA261G05]|uniref:Tc1-like transposase DDE domain-containing protein n=2 Tax=candidate division MSBL1 TaxID=215777 RepID=A0A133VBA4_9EURY|nr:hypothetical protein AKJ47_01770 [candidate division MSBL1 archaeon SCGC-AAA261G05]KXB04364.1 hypothetical protein AKJ48_02840 [candidate division MSBL1 archaeon SCGC-AAA261O19]